MGFGIRRCQKLETECRVLIQHRGCTPASAGRLPACSVRLSNSASVCDHVDPRNVPGKESSLKLQRSQPPIPRVDDDVRAMKRGASAPPREEMILSPLSLSILKSVEK